MTTLRGTAAVPVLGPCSCPSCGWDDGGELRVVDWTEELHPPFAVRGADRFAVWGDDPVDHTRHGVTLCPWCDEPLSDLTAVLGTQVADENLSGEASAPGPAPALRVSDPIRGAHATSLDEPWHQDVAGAEDLAGVYSDADPAL